MHYFNVFLHVFSVPRTRSQIKKLEQEKENELKEKFNIVDCNIVLQNLKIADQKEVGAKRTNVRSRSVDMSESFRLRLPWLPRTPEKRRSRSHQRANSSNNRRSSIPTSNCAVVQPGTPKPISKKGAVPRTRSKSVSFDRIVSSTIDIASTDSAVTVHRFLVIRAFLYRYRAVQN